ncbi:MAG: hypothetical protein ACRDZR_05330 [Acidimicrobiales bacterium]
MSDRGFVSAEAPDGQVRLRAPLTHQLAEAVMPRCAEHLGPVAGGLARRVAAHAPGVEAATPLTNRRRKAARAETRVLPVVAVSGATRSGGPRG